MASISRAKECALQRIAESQHGLVSRSQALACGYSDSAISRCISAGLWQRPYRGVYCLRPSTRTVEAQLTALVLRAPGRTWASHRAAARLWGLETENREVIEVSTTANLRGPRRTIHPVAAMPSRDRDVVRGVPVTGIERTLMDLAAVVPARRAEAAVIAALRLRLASIHDLRARLETAGDAGRFGPPRLRAVLERWSDLFAAESVLEGRLRRLIRAHGLPAGVPQLRIFDGDQFVARVDLAYPAQKIAIEADGYRWHGDPARWRSDLARRNSLTRLGWRVLHFTWTDIEHDGHRVASEIRSALGAPPPNLSFSPVRREKTTGSAT